MTEGEMRGESCEEEERGRGKKIVKGEEPKNKAVAEKQEWMGSAP